MTPAVRLRPARPMDHEFLLALRNDPDVRRESRSQALVEPGGHREWLAATFANPMRHLYVIEVEGRAVGQLRLDREITGDAEVSLALLPDERGRGTGHRALAAARAVAAELGLHTLRAVVKLGNEASLAAFRSAGYTIRREENGLLELTASVTEDV